MEQTHTTNPPTIPPCSLKRNTKREPRRTIYVHNLIYYAKKIQRKSNRKYSDSKQIQDFTHKTSIDERTIGPLKNLKWTQTTDNTITDVSHNAANTLYV